MPVKIGKTGCTFSMLVAEIMPGVPVKQWPELYCRIPRAELNVP